MRVGHILLLCVPGVNQTHTHVLMAEGTSACSNVLVNTTPHHRICEAPPFTQAQHDHHFTGIKKKTAGIDCQREGKFNSNKDQTGGTQTVTLTLTPTSPISILYPGCLLT